MRLGWFSMQRGKIVNRNRAAQIRDFTGLCFGNITPTDIDGLLDFGNKLFVLIEAKVDDTELPYGQRLALERLCDGLEVAGKMSIVLIVTHHTTPDQDIDVANCQVVHCRYRGRWIEPEKPMTCREAIELFRNLAGVH